MVVVTGLAGMTMGDTNLELPDVEVDSAKGVGVGIWGLGLFLDPRGLPPLLFFEGGDFCFRCCFAVEVFLLWL